MKILKRPKLMIGIAAFGLLTSLFVFAILPKVEAAFGSQNWQGYFYGNQEFYGDQVVPGGIPSSVNSANSLISFVENQYNGNAAQKTAGAFIILDMLVGQNIPKYFPGYICSGRALPSDPKNAAGWSCVQSYWEQVVRGYANEGLLNFNWWTPSNFSCENTYYEPSYADIADYSDCAHTQNAHSIAFFNPTNRSQPVFVIRWACGNPIGDLSSRVPTWQLSGKSKVSGTALPGSTVTFSHGVKNLGPNSAAYDWTVEDSTNGGAYYNHSLPTGSPNNISPGNWGPDISTYSSNFATKSRFTIPSGAPAGYKYCQRIKYTYADGPGTSTGYSSPACITVGTSSALCNSITVTDDGGYKNGDESSERVDHDVTETLVSISGTTNDVSNNRIANNGSKTYSYQAISPTISIVIVRKYYEEDSRKWLQYGSTSTQNINCYHAHCNVTSIEGDGPWNGSYFVPQVNHGFTITATLTNDNTDPNAETIPASVGGYNLSLTEPPENGKGWYTENDVGQSVNVGQTSDPISISFTAPPNISYYTINLYPDFYGHGGLGTGCSITVPVYQNFNIIPSAGTPTGNPEDPTSITYTTSGANQGPADPVSATASSWLTMQPSGGVEATVDGPHVAGHSYGTASDGPFT